MIRLTAAVAAAAVAAYKLGDHLGYERGVVSSTPEEQLRLSLKRIRRNFEFIEVGGS